MKQTAFLTPQRVLAD